MTGRLRQALSNLTEQAAVLPEKIQDGIAARLETIASDMYWEQLLEDPECAAILDELADEALADFATGKTKPLSEVFGEA